MPVYPCSQASAVPTDLLSVDKTESEPDSSLTRGEAGRLRRAGWSSTAARKVITPGFKATARIPISSYGTILPRSNHLFTQPAASRIDDASRPSAGMIPIVPSQPVWAQPAASVLLKTIVRAIGVIICDIVLGETTQMSLVEDEYVIQKIVATAPDPAFSNSILPGACWANVCGFHAGRRQHIGHLCAELGITTRIA